MIEPVMSHEELNDIVSDGLPSWQARYNETFIRSVHASLKDGGVWGWPAGQRAFQRRGDGWIEVTGKEGP